jgi:hypothetical protein
MHAEARHVRPDGWDIDLILVNDSLGLDPPAVVTVRTAIGQRDLDRLVDVIGDWATGSRAIGRPRPAAGPARLGLRSAAGERCGLPLGSALGVFQLLFQRADPLV